VNKRNHGSHGQIFTISRLTADIKRLLEDKFPFIWITGEISNFRRPVSGHFYFALKDDSAQVNAVMFRGQNQMLKFVLEDGMRVTGFGRISVYEPRGTYQLILEYLEPKGIGALQAAFEQLKAKLADEGLFDNRYKRPIPYLPRKLAVVTSPTGAVVHDILNILDRRFPTIPVVIFPVKVQGKGAEGEIEAAFHNLNGRSDIDVIILARGGGSIEDLQAFNSETVARAIFRSEIPVISAIGHETDYTISDFVADLRAPTPSAAAELSVPIRDALYQKHMDLFIGLKSSFHRFLKDMHTRLEGTSKRLLDPRKKLTDLRLRTDEFTDRIIRAMNHLIRSNQSSVSALSKRLISLTPQKMVVNNKLKLKEIINKLKYVNEKIHSNKKSEYHRLIGKLDTLNPHAVLDRGYSITQRISDRCIVYNSEMVGVGDKVKVTLSKGTLISRIERIK
jgi:exodeoxyribonuclease VII large subunit